MLLTIGMIVKNEEKWLDKCLSAIKPILDNVDSELIITDTGSTDKTVDIARKYTDKVLHFDWINDFSAARNFGLEKAQGEWFMMLDADDIFKSCDEIIKFFNSGDYKKYNSATYISRNIFNTADLSDYSDLRAQRLCRILSETKYINRVHEYLNTFGEPIKNINDVAVHYGYAYDNGVNILAKKQDRNLELLLKRLEIEGDMNEILYIQIFQCYSAKFEHEKADEYLEKGKEICLKNKSIVLAVIYAEKARLEFRNNNFMDVVEICDLYYSMDKAIRHGTLTTDAEMFFLRAMSLKNLERYDEALIDFCDLFDIYYDVICGKIITDDTYLQSYEFAIDKNYVSAFCDFIECSIATRKYDVINQYIKEFPKEFIDDKLDAKVKDKLIYSLISLFLASENKCVLSLLEDKYNIYRNYFEISENDLIDLVCRYGINDNPDLVAVMMKKKYDISLLLTTAGADLKKCAYKCCKFIIGFYDIAENYSEKYIRNTDNLPIASEFISHCISMRLIENENKSKEYKEKKIEKLFQLKNNINEQYKAQKVAEEFKNLSEVIKQNIRIYISDGNFVTAKKTIEDYKKLVPDDPEINELLNLIQVNT